MACTFVSEQLISAYYLRISSLLGPTRRWKQIVWTRLLHRTTSQLGFAILLELSIGSRLLIWHFLFLSWANIIIHFGFKQAYASILYLHVPDTFRIILRGCDVEPHNVVNDLMYRECVLYKPQIAGLTEVLYKSHLQIMFAFFYHFDCWNKPFHWLILFSIAVSWKRNVCAFSFLEFRMTNGEKKWENLHETIFHLWNVAT
jgi:hypothetical protein